MFAQRRGKADICDVTDFQVRYIGKAETFVAARKGCTHDVVQKIWDNSPEEYLLKRITLSISAAGLSITDQENKRFQEKVPIKDVSHCCAERSPHERVFTWISKNKRLKKLECHAVICQNKEKAQMMAVLLHRAFQVAYVEWKNKKGHKVRPKNSSSSGESEPRVWTSSDDGDRASTSSAGSSAEVPSRMIAMQDDVDCGDDDDDDEEYSSNMLSQMNMVEENEISFAANNITVNPAREEMSTWT